MKKLLLLLLLISYFNTVAQNKLTNNLLLHYEFDNNVEDSSENEYDGTDFNIEYGLDRYGNENSAAVFNGIDSYVDLPNEDELKPDLPVTISFWVNYQSELTIDRAVFNTSFEEDRNTGIFLTEQSSTGNYALGFGDGKYSYSSLTRRSFVSNFEISTEEWKHIIIVVSSPLDMKIYVDGVEREGEYSGSGGELKYSDLPGTIGRHDQDSNLPAYYFKGLIDDFMYWNRALAEEEVEFLNNLSVLSTNTKLSTSNNKIVVFPNPVLNILNIKSFHEIQDLNLFDTNGKKYPVDIKRGQTKFDFSNFSKGVYFLKIKTNLNTQVRKLVIK